MVVGIINALIKRTCLIILAASFRKRAHVRSIRTTMTKMAEDDKQVLQVGQQILAGNFLQALRIVLEALHQPAKDDAKALHTFLVGGDVRQTSSQSRERAEVMELIRDEVLAVGASTRFWRRLFPFSLLVI